MYMMIRQLPCCDIGDIYQAVHAQTFGITVRLSLLQLSNIANLTCVVCNLKCTVKQFYEKCYIIFHKLT